MTLLEIQAAINEAACLMCAQLSPQTLSYLQLQQLSNIAQSGGGGGGGGGTATPALRYPGMGVTNALTKEVIVATSAATLLTAMVNHKAGTDLYFQVFDASSIPAEGATPLLSIKAPSDILAWYDFGTVGFPMQTGIVMVLSQTFAVKTSGPVGATTGLFTATYR